MDEAVLRFQQHAYNECQRVLSKAYDVRFLDTSCMLLLVDNA